MENFLGYLEYFMSMQYLVDLGDFYIAQCANIGGEWVNDACVNTNLDDKLDGYIESIK